MPKNITLTDRQYDEIRDRRTGVTLWDQLLKVGRSEGNEIRANKLSVFKFTNHPNVDCTFMIVQIHISNKQIK